MRFLIYSTKMPCLLPATAASHKIQGDVCLAGGKIACKCPVQVLQGDLKKKVMATWKSKT